MEHAIGPSGLPSPSRRAAERPYRVLVVDDNPINRKLCGLFCDLLELEVEYAEDGDEAVAAAEARSFDLILMDINMPHVSGVEATRAIRRLPSPAGSTPIIAVTSAVEPSEAAYYRAEGMNDVVAKPISARELMGAISRALTPPPSEPRSWQEPGQARFQRRF